MSLLEKMKGVRYRARIFDHNLHISTVEVPDRGQRYITITVRKKTLGIFGDETKLAFMINPDIPPKIFGGFIQELDFDIKDATPLADIVDLIPDLVYEINENYKLIQEEKEKAILEMKEKPGIESIIEPLPTPAPEETKEEANEGTKETVVPVEEKIEETKESKEVKKPEPPSPKKPGILITSSKLLDILTRLKNEGDGPEKNKTIKECLELCVLYPKLLYWLPKHLKIDQEVHAIVSQSRVKRVGVLPSYYVNQANAMIAEKVLARPAPKPGWQDVIIIIAVFAFIIGFIALILHAAGLF